MEQDFLEVCQMWKACPTTILWNATQFQKLFFLMFLCAFSLFVVFFYDDIFVIGFMLQYFLSSNNIVFKFSYFDLVRPWNKYYVTILKAKLLNHDFKNICFFKNYFKIFKFRYFELKMSLVCKFKFFILVFIHMYLHLIWNHEPK